MLIPEQLSPVELQFHIESLQGRYVECIDDDRLEEWPDYFTQDCVYRIISRENVDRGLPVAAISCDSKGMLQDRVIALRHANIYAKHHYRHVLSNILVKQIAGPMVHVQSNYLVLQTLLNGDTQIYNAGKYQDKVVFTAQGPKFQEKLAIFDTYRIPNLLVTPV